MTSMPASRRARATTLMPRSCPSRPTLARTTRGGRGTIIGRREWELVGAPTNRAGTLVVLMIAVFEAAAGDVGAGRTCSGAATGPVIFRVAVRYERMVRVAQLVRASACGTN